MLHIMFNGFPQPIEVVAELTGTSEKELLIDQQYDVCIESCNDSKQYVNLSYHERRALVNQCSVP